MSTERIDVVITERGGPVVKRTLDDIGRSGLRAQGSVDLLTRAFSALAGVIGIAQFVRLNDTFLEMSNRLRLVTTGVSNLTRVTSELFAVANRTRFSFEATATLYARVALSTKQLGYSQRELINFVEGVNQATILSGVSAREATAAMIQFSQGLAKGRLDGDELRSVLEQLPFVADVIGDHLNATRFELKELGREGKLTPAVIIEAFKAMEGELGPMVSRLGWTFSQAWVVIENQVMQSLGPLSEQISRFLGTALATVADNFDTLTIAVASLTPLMAALAGKAAIGAVIAGLMGISAWIMANPFTFLIGAIGGAVVAYGQLDGEMDDLLKQMDRHVTFIDKMSATWAGFRSYVQAAWEDFPQWFGDLMKWAMDNALRQFARIADMIPESIMKAGDWVGKQAESLGMSGTFYRNLFNDIAKEFKTGEEIIRKVGADQDNLLLNPDRLQIAGDAYTQTYRDVLLKLSKTRGELLEGSGEGSGAGSGSDSSGGKGKSFAEIQNELIREIELLSMASRERERSISLQRIEQDMKRRLTVAEGSLLDEMLKVMQSLEDQSKLYDEIRGPIEQYQYDLDAVNILYRSGRIELDEYIAKVRELEIAMLESDTSFGGGISRGLLKVQQGLEDLSIAAEDLVVKGFRGMEDALTDFVTTGKLSFKSLIDSIKQDMARLAVQQLISRPMAMQSQDMRTADKEGRQFDPMTINQYSGSFGGNSLVSAGNFIGSQMVTEFGAGLTAGAGGALTDAGATALMNIGTKGSSSFAAGSTVGGIGLSSIMGYGSAIMSAVSGDYGSAIGTAIGTYIMPGIGTVLGGMVGSLADGIFGGGPPKTRHGQREFAEFSGDAWNITSRDDRQAAGTGEAIVQYAKQAVDSANTLFGKIGIDAAIEEFYALTESSVMGDRQGVASGGTLRSGGRTRQIGIGRASDMTFAGFGGWSEAEMLPRLMTDIQLSILEAFQTQVDSLPEVLANMIRGVNIRALDAAGAQELALRFNAVVEEVAQFQTAAQTMPFGQLRDLSFDAAAGLLELTGGLQNLTNNLTSYYQNFYSEGERAAFTWANIDKALAAVNVTVPSTREAFRNLVEAQDLTTDSGRKVYAALMNVQGAFASVTESAEELATRTRENAVVNFQSAYETLVSIGQAEIAKLQQSFSVTDTALNSYRSAVRSLETEFESLFSSINKYVVDLRNEVDSTARLQYQQARAVISTALVTGQLPKTADLAEALKVAQQGATSQRYSNAFEERRAVLTLANDMQALKEIAVPELDTAKATLAQLEKEYALLRGMAVVGEDSLASLEAQVRAAITAEEQARHQISIIEEQLEQAKKSYETLLSIDAGVKSFPEALQAFASSMATLKSAGGGGGGGGGGGTGGWTPDNLPAGAENLSAAQRYVLYNTDLLQDQAKSGMSVDAYAAYHWNTYGKYEDRNIGLNSYAVGTDFVPRDMTANIHRGEIIINPRDANILRNYGIQTHSQGVDAELLAELRETRRHNERMAGYLRESTKELRRISRHTESLERPPVKETTTV